MNVAVVEIRCGRAAPKQVPAYPTPVLAHDRSIRRGNVRVLRPVHPSVGLEVQYARALRRMVQEMHESVTYWIELAYRSNPPAMAQDALPANIMRIAVRRLVGRWTDRFNEAAERMAEHFALEIEDRSSGALRRILRDAGWQVKFRNTTAVRDVMQATIQQNVSLIKSIPEQYLARVEQMVMESVQRGGDLQSLSEGLQQRYDVTRRRAELIARDQNTKATSAFQRARYQEVGIERAVWMHSHAGREPRPTHVRMNGKTYDVSKGMWDSHEGEYVQPGQLINCRCVSRPVVEGFT